MPQHDQLHNFYNVNSSCEDGTYRPNIATAVTFSLEDSEFMGEPLLASSPVDTIISDHRDSYSQDLDEWQTKPVKEWTPQDIVQWVNSEARSLNVCCTEMAGEKFAQYDGSQLLSFSRTVFSDIDSRFGPILFQKLNEIAASRYQQCRIVQSKFYCAITNKGILRVKLNGGRCIKYGSGESQEDKVPCMTNLDSLREEPSFRQPPMSPGLSGKTMDSSVPALSPPPAPKKKGPGRPKGSKRKKKPEKLGRLWEFLRDLLKNREYCPSLIVWDNYEEGMFRFVHSDKVAKLWGTKKDNPDMNYEKLSRAMRYYYKSKVLLPVYGRRLVYKFGPTATGWKVDNPNFKD
uniref:ETS domain-containing protein n=1 Tax=Rhodnius prolixus TaxID=13249 RepID=T1IFW7_RHOPR